MQNSYKRVDAHLSSLGYCSRSEAKKFLKMFRVSLNGVRLFDTNKKVYHNDITVNEEALDPESLTILMHKPSGIICSHDNEGVLIYSLLPERWQRRNSKISTIGRLDGDTTGAILLTDDGALNHRLTSPKNHIAKLYEVRLAQPLRGDEEEIFASGTLLLNGEKKPLHPAKMEILSETHVRLEISEGRYHQVKRMFGAVGNRVVALHRVSFGNYSIKNLAVGEYEVLRQNKNIVATKRAPQKLREEHWNEVFSTKDYTQVLWHQSSPKKSMEFIGRFAKKEDSIIDVGCGASVLVDNLLKEGYKNISLLDSSKISLEIVKKRVADDNLTYICRDILNFVPAKKFDVWHDRAVFHFLTTQKERSHYFEVLKNSLHEEGSAIISTFRVDGPEACAGLEIVQYDYNKMLNELPKELELVESEEYAHITPKESEQKYIYFVIRKYKKTNNLKNCNL